MKRVPLICIFSVFLVIMSSCAQNKDYVVTIKTSYGDMVAILYDETPKHKENFIKLAKEHLHSVFSNTTPNIAIKTIEKRQLFSSFIPDDIALIFSQG